MQTIRLMIVDDDKLCLLIASKLLQAHPLTKNYTIELFEDPQEGLDFVKTFLHSSSENSLIETLFILLDISMPVIDGWVFLEELDKIDPHEKIKVFMHSSSVGESDLNKAASFRRVVYYFNKPLSSQKLVHLHSLISDLTK
ncbi:response regulator [Algoriphagus vanfongensis]|uniref:response regulator n=1 Tax=Algoriphagus vanfongensis TaxID=426371 RepID=UPI00047B7818|nr:response regulator [Algoriphagus vanfongensis]